MPPAADFRLAPWDMLFITITTPCSFLSAITPASPLSAAAPTAAVPEGMESFDLPHHPAGSFRFGGLLFVSRLSRPRKCERPSPVPDVVHERGADPLSPLRPVPDDSGRHGISE